MLVHREEVYQELVAIEQANADAKRWDLLHDATAYQDGLRRLAQAEADAKRRRDERERARREQHDADVTQRAKKRRAAQDANSLFDGVSP